MDTPYQRNPLPRRPSVSFHGVDWVEEEKKTQQGLGKRRRERRHRKTQAKMSKEQLTTFLRFVVSPEQESQDYPVMQLDACDLWLKRIEGTGELTYPEGASNVDKLNMALDKCDAILSKPSVHHLTGYWMEKGIEKGLYSKQSTANSVALGTTDSPLTLSRSSDGTMTTITLSSDNIHDSVAKSIIEAAVFAA